MDNIEFREFREFIGHVGFINLGYTGPRFIWCNNRQGTARVWEMIDRALVIAAWLHCFPSYHVQHLSRVALDHYLLLISIDYMYIPRAHSSLRSFGLSICILGL